MELHHRYALKCIWGGGGRKDRWRIPGFPDRVNDCEKCGLH